MVIKYKNTPIHTELYGSGEPLVLLHGFLENSKIWNDFIPFLKEHHQVVCIDLFGHGKTAHHADVHTMEEMAEAVEKVLNHFDISSATLIGHSMGGYVTLAFAEQYKTRVKNMLLLNSSPFADSQERLEERDRAIRIVQKHKKAFLRGSIGNLFADGNREQHEAVLQHHVDDCLAMETASIIASLKGMKIRKDRTGVLHNFPRKKCLIAGKKDPIIPYDDLKKVAKKTNSKIIGLPGGHLSYIEQQERVKEGLKQFLDL